MAASVQCLWKWIIHRPLWVLFLKAGFLHVMENQSYWEKPAPAKICFSEEWPELIKWMVRAFKLLDVQAWNSAALRLAAEGIEGTQKRLHYVSITAAPQFSLIFLNEKDNILFEIQVQMYPPRRRFNLWLFLYIGRPLNPYSKPTLMFPGSGGKIIRLLP